MGPCKTAISRWCSVTGVVRVVETRTKARSYLRIAVSKQGKKAELEGGCSEEGTRRIRIRASRWWWWWAGMACKGGLDNREAMTPWT